MEEIITLDGKQFKLTTDRPLTATERQQTIAQIRAQTGCSSCRQPSTLSAGLYGLNVPKTPSAGASTSGKRSLDNVDLSVRPDGGVGPYEARFYITHNTAGGDGTLISTGRLSVILAGGSTGINPMIGITELSTATVRYVLDDIDINLATGGALGTPVDVDVATGDLITTTASLPLTAGSIRFITSIVDSCTSTGGPGTCVQWADVATTCVAPTCNFVVA